MRALAYLVVLSQGWRRRTIAFIAGAVGSLALAPFDFFPALAVPMSVAVWLIDGAVGKSGKPEEVGANVTFGGCKAAAVDGWWLGLGYFTAGLWWMGSALLVEPDKFLWALPLAVLGIPALLACFTAAGFAIAKLLWSPNAMRVFGLAFGLGVTEWSRSYVLTGFPWNLFGMALGGNLIFAQSASLVGIAGLTFLSVAIFATPATAVDGAKIAAPAGPTLTKLLKSPPGLALIVLLSMALFGWTRLQGGLTLFEQGVKLRVMQPNVPQDEKFRPENKESILGHYLALSDRATSPQTNGMADVTHLIWPESAFPSIIANDPVSLGRIGAVLGDTTVLITGAARVENQRSGLLPGEARALYYNSIYAIGKGGRILDTYDKTHLVPFGEYMPFSATLEKYGIRHLVHIPGGFTAGVTRKALNVPGLPLVAALVCYEAVFSGNVMPDYKPNGRPGLLLNVTNDGWFGVTTGPYQHFAQSRLRAIEEGLPLVRSANTGISAVVDAYGRILKALPLGVEGVIDSPLPKRIEPTPFSENPFVGPLTLMLLMAAGALLGKSHA